MIPENLRLIATSATLVRVAGPAAAIWIGNALSAQEWAEKEHGESWWWSTKADIEERSGLSDEQQETARRRLRDLGILEERRGVLKRGASLATIWYRLDLAALSAIVYRESRQTKTEDPGKGLPKNPANDHTSSHTSSHDKNTPLPPKGGEGPRKRSKRSCDPEQFDALIPMDFQTEAFMAAWHEMVLDRHERKRAVTELAAKKLLKMLATQAKTPEVAIGWIETSLRNGWTGVFPDRVAPKPASGVGARREADESLMAQLRNLPSRPAPLERGTGAYAAF